MKALVDVARAHVQRAQALGKSLDARRKEKEAGSEKWTVDEDYRRDFAMVTTAIQHAGKAYVMALEQSKKNREGLTDEQLQAQFNAELIRAAGDLSDEQWSAMCAARQRAARERVGDVR